MKYKWTACSVDDLNFLQNAEKKCGPLLKECESDKHCAPMLQKIKEERMRPKLSSFLMMNKKTKSIAYRVYNCVNSE